MLNSRRKILLVDDHGDTGKVFQMLLERQGYLVTVALSVKAALSAAKTDTFDLLISDIGLPDGSGLDIMRTLNERNKEHGAKRMKGIALSGFGMEEDVQRSYEVGFAKHLTKPISFPVLKEAVETILAAD